VSIFDYFSDSVHPLFWGEPEDPGEPLCFYEQDDNELTAG
jgi:hypothetical protein